MNADLPTDPQERLKLIELAKKRYRISKDYFSPKHEIWVRCYKIYRALADAVDDPEEENMFIPYAFGMIEDIVSRLVEPVLQKLPVHPKARSQRFTTAARNFYSLVKTYLSTSRYQLEYTDSNRQKVITGNRWEKDEFLSEWIEGLEWKQIVVNKMVNTAANLLGKVIPLQVMAKFNKLIEAPKLYPKNVGYRCRFPSVFLVWPEPGIKRVEDMHWLIEEEESIALDDLRKQKYKDAQGNIKSVYDLTEIDRDYQKHEPGSISPNFDDKSVYHEQISDVLGSRNIMSDSRTDGQGKDGADMDKVHLLHVHEPGRRWTIANGKYLVLHIDKPLHRPRIPFRLDCYTPDPENLYGLGAIEPTEDLFLELNDIHRLSMRSWVRMINGLVAYHVGAVPFKDDWKPKAGGRVRIDPGVSPSIHNAIASIQLQDPTNSMLTHESNSKGLLERVISIADMSPGASGTKQYHDTATGLLEIQNQLAKRFSTMRRAQMANYQDQMQAMYDLAMQFMFEPLPVKVVDPDGKTLYPKFTRDDIWTDGEGFDFVIEEDPSFGDNVVQRNQLMVLLDIAIKYETYRMNTKDPELLKFKVSEVMRRLVEAFGWTFNAELLGPVDNVLTPDAELNMILNGMPVEPNPQENLLGHAVDHIAQMMSPKIQQGAAAGQITPEMLATLKAHIQDTMMMAQAVMQNPQGAAQAKIADIMKGQAMAGGPPEGMPEAANVSPAMGTGAAGKPGTMRQGGEL